MLRLLSCCLALMCGAAPAFSAPAAPDDDAALVAGVFTPPRVAPDFSLRGSGGGTLQLKHYRGKVVLLAFGYSSCHEVCPVTLATLAHARRKLGAAGADVQVVYITVDPERDDVARMHQFLALFDPTFIGGSGTPDDLAAVRRQYGITVTRHDTIDGYVLSHSSFVYLIDRRSMLRALMPFGHGVDDFAHDMGVLLKEKG